MLDFSHRSNEQRKEAAQMKAAVYYETGRPEVGRLDWNRSETNAQLDDWHRGAIVRISEIVRKTKGTGQGTVGRIERTATVEIVRSVTGCN